MGKINFVKGELSQEHVSGIEPYFFSHPDHLALQREEGWHQFSAVNNKKEILATFHINVLGDVASSPVKSPFGGIHFSDKLSAQDLQTFIAYSCDQLKALGAATVTIKCPPQNYTPIQSEILYNALFTHGFSVINSELSAIIDINEAGFANGLSADNKRRLKRAQQSEFEFRKFPVHELSSIYGFTKAYYDSKGYDLSMDYDSLKSTLVLSPERFYILGLYDKELLIATAITIAVNSKILYNFYLAHDEKYNAVSPVILLINNLYNLGKSEGYSLLDLGTSAIDDQPNFNLLRFKQNLGGHLNLKLTFKKELTT